jgi:NADH-quinone oxidoreductase subunit G
VPRRAGDRGAVEVGALPTLLPGGRPVSDAAARSDVARAWAAEVPETVGRDTNGILAAATAGELGALLVAGVDPDDLADPAAARAALAAVPFLVSIELRASAVTEVANVVFPVAAATEKAGTYLNWEGRLRDFAASLEATGRLLDLEVLNAIADEMDVHLGLPDLATTRAEFQMLAPWGGARVTSPSLASADVPQLGAGEAVLATWHHLLDAGSLQDGEPFLAGTARKPVVRLSAATAAEIGAAEGQEVAVSTDRGTITLPLAITDMPERVVWLPTNSAGSAVRRDLGVDGGAVVRIASVTASVTASVSSMGGTA